MQAFHFFHFSSSLFPEKLYNGNVINLLLEVHLMKYGFGIDLGGTTVKIAYFDELGTMLD